MKYKKLICRKKNGDMYISAAVGVFVLSIFLLVVTLAFASWMSQLMLADEVDLAMTSTMKRMETVGYLDDTTANELKEELQAIGMENIVFTGSTDAAHKPAYGGKIKLVLSGKIESNSEFNAISNFLNSTNECGLTYQNKTKEGTNKSR